ncbi:hypothetical protein RR46_06149 [Papilio xuthus]|uniref:Uncharacterized protein n=1 Tax=Papilio xuthus TaxID=66420 RepID=A0A194QHR2_PAPXU|nr:hypothetical protein RR46_06149 [Papilio xuthus]
MTVRADACDISRGSAVLPARRLYECATMYSASARAREAEARARLTAAANSPPTRRAERIQPHRLLASSARTNLTYYVGCEPNTVCGTQLWNNDDVASVCKHVTHRARMSAPTAF